MVPKRQVAFKWTAEGASAALKIAIWPLACRRDPDGRCRHGEANEHAYGQPALILTIWHDRNAIEHAHGQPPLLAAI